MKLYSYRKDTLRIVLDESIELSIVWGPATYSDNHDLYEHEYFTGEKDVPPSKRIEVAIFLNDHLHGDVVPYINVRTFFIEMLPKIMFYLEHTSETTLEVLVYEIRRILISG